VEQDCSTLLTALQDQTQAATSLCQESKTLLSEVQGLVTEAQKINLTHQEQQKVNSNIQQQLEEQQKMNQTHQELVAELKGKQQLVFLLPASCSLDGSPDLNFIGEVNERIRTINEAASQPAGSKWSRKRS
jgi:uncharacterized phage infection (PIP) family protein YhgE